MVAILRHPNRPIPIAANNTASSPAMVNNLPMDNHPRNRPMARNNHPMVHNNRPMAHNNHPMVSPHMDNRALFSSQAQHRLA